MEKEVFKNFIEDLCNHAEAQLDFFWREDEDGSKPSQLVSQLLSPKVATALLTRLEEEQSVVNFTIVESTEVPGFSQLMASTASITGINESIIRKLNERNPVPGYTWEILTSDLGESFVGIKVDFSSKSSDSSNEDEARTFNHLIHLPQKLESSYGILSLYKTDKKDGDHLSLTEVSYTAYKNLFRSPSLIHALLNYSFLNSTAEETPAAVVGMLLS